MLELFNVNFNVNLKLFFLRLLNCASVGEKKNFDNCQDARYVRENYSSAE